MVSKQKNRLTFILCYFILQISEHTSTQQVCSLFNRSTSVNSVFKIGQEAGPREQLADSSASVSDWRVPLKLSLSLFLKFSLSGLHTRPLFPCPPKVLFLPMVVPSSSCFEPVHTGGPGCPGSSSMDSLFDLFRLPLSLSSKQDNQSHSSI